MKIYLVEAYKITDSSFDATGRTLEKNGEKIKNPELKVINNITIKTYHKVGDIFDTLNVGFSMFRTAEQMCQEGVHDPDAIVTEMVVTGIEEVVIDQITGKVVTFALKLVLAGGGGLAYWVTAFVLDYVLADYFGAVAEQVEKFFREDFLPFMDKYSATLQASHERDIEAGIRLD